MKKRAGSGVGFGSGSISERYISGDLDPHQNVTDPQNGFSKPVYHAVYNPRMNMYYMSSFNIRT